MGQFKKLWEILAFNQQPISPEEAEQQAAQLCHLHTGFTPTADSPTPHGHAGFGLGPTELAEIACVIAGNKPACWLGFSKLTDRQLPGENQIFDALLRRAEEKHMGIVQTSQGLVVAKTPEHARQLADAVEELKQAPRHPESPDTIDTPEQKRAHRKIGYLLGYPPEMVGAQFPAEEGRVVRGFRRFLESEEKENVEKMIAKLPKGHQKLLKGYKFHYTPGNTLKGDDEHIGFIHNNKIVVAAPWNYGREFTTLHEIAHLIWEKLMTPKLKKQWAEVVKRTKNKQKQNPEELFCMAYACYYAKHKIKIHDHPEWHAFIKNKVPE